MAFEISTFSSTLSFNTMVHMITIKLYSSNFLLWRSQLIPLLQCQDLLGHVDCTIPMLTAIILSSDVSSPNPKYVDWKHHDQSILSLLLSSLTEEALVEVIGLTTSRDVCFTLENSFSHKSKTREIHLKDDLQMMKHGTHSVSEYSGSF